MRKKRFLFLLLSVLLGTGGAFAQQPITSYKDLKDATEKVNSLSDLETQINRLQTIVDQNEANPVSPYIYGVTTVYDTIQSAKTIKKFVDLSVYKKKPESAITIAYRVTTITDDWGDKGYIVQVTTSDIATKEAGKGGTWTTVSSNIIGNTTEQGTHIFKDPDTNVNITAAVLVVFYEKDDLFQTTDGSAISGSPLMRLFGATILPIIKSEAGKVPLAPEDKQTQATNPDYKTWKEKADKAAEDLTTAKNKKTAAEKFKNLKIANDIKILSTDSQLDEWPAGCTIQGDNNHIINDLGTALFSVNNGNIYDLISLDQSIASTNNGNAIDCIVKSTRDKKYYIYNAEGGAGQGFSKLEDAIYSERDTYGMDFSAKPEGDETKEAAIKRSVGLKADDDSNKLYQAKYTNAELYAAAEDKGDESSYVRSFKVNIKDKALEYSGMKLSLSNAVVYIDDTDANDNSNVSTLTNVAVKKGKNYVCAKAELTDGAGKPGFYVPYGFKATNFSYDRVFNKNKVAVCLPFALTSDKLNEIGAKAYKLKDVLTDKKAMRLDLIEGQTVAANTPCFLVFDNPSGSAEFENMSDMEIASTEGANLSLGDNIFGNYGANQTSADLKAQVKDKVSNPVIYGIQDGGFVQMPDSPNTHLYAFRSFIALDKNITNETGARFTISLLDEEGNEEVTGIELVSTANNTNSDFKAVGGNNAIEITTGKACDVKVYTLNGALAKTARVEAGTTTLPMNAGMYVVNKTKVIVK